jgi:hypothetical protein
MQSPKLRQLANDFKRGGRLLILSFTVSALWVVALFFIEPNVNADEVATAATVPLLISYLMIRGIIWLASGARELSTEEKLEMGKAHKDGRSVEISAFLGAVFACGMWLFIAGLLSVGVYYLLGMPWAVRATVKLIEDIMALVAFIAVWLCLSRLCRPWMIKMAKFFHALLDRPIPRPHWVRALRAQ